MRFTIEPTPPGRIGDGGYATFVQSHRPRPIAVGDRATVDHTGEVVTVHKIKCNLCDGHRMHDECERWAMVGQRRWVNLDHLTKEA